MTPLRVAFDVTPVISGRTGIARYVTEVGAALLAQGVDVRRFAVGRNAYPVPSGTRHLRVPARVVQAGWDRLDWPPVERLTSGIDLVHETGLLMPSTRRPLVVTVHDMAALRHPELHPSRHVEQQRAQLATLHRAAAIVTVSAATADDLAHLGIAQDRLVVAPLGLTTPAEPRATTPIGGRFVLTVGESSPRKGYDTLLRAVARVGADLRLVMAGPPAGDHDRLRSLVGELGLGDRVMFLGAVDDPTLAALYRDALALCFPSVAEGFGLPVLEAMAAGLPVIASDIAVLREVAGTSAIYAPPRDERAWAEAIDSVVSDPPLRAELSAASRSRVTGFTWERTARETLAAYRLALATA